MGYRFDQEQCRNLDFSSRHEWVLTNGAGGFAMGTIAGLNTRRYHGHLLSCSDSMERTLLLANIECTLQAEGNPVSLSTNQYPGAIFPEGYLYLESFEVGTKAVWRWRVGKCRLEKVIWLVRHENAAVIEYRNVGEIPFSLALRPLVAHRSYHGEFHESADYPQRMLFEAEATAVVDDPTPIRIEHTGAQRVPVQGWYYRFDHARELERGLNYREDLYCPCELQYELAPGQTARLMVNTYEEMDLTEPVQSPLSQPLGASLASAAGVYLIDKPGSEAIIAGYPWFTSWGRDTMISLPGLCLHTGRIDLARRILMRYSEHLKKGLIPNRFVEDGGADYNTVDATLWFVQALYETLKMEWDIPFAEFAYECIKDVLHCHRKGTEYGIRVDLEDGLLTQGVPGEQLTWMDAKIGDWVVTPRHGKPVEINGLWVNALWVMAWLSKELGKQSWRYEKAAKFAEDSFESKFWCASRGHYFDTVDPFDATLRPNQLIAMSLPFGPAKGKRAEQALSHIERELLTPYGLRTMGPSESGYQARFEGTLRELDAAYHQGTVWPWLMGPYVTALDKLRGDKGEAKRILRQGREMLTEYGIGGLAEVYDGDAPHRANGCPWQAWSVAEWLRAWKENADGD
ncbi:MAG: glycogen debranching enzyme family protein [Fimbriimonadaceae bacterium]|nr:glycogen debranching enzyme family protein [Fimbriimonadaceae bacterium]